VNTTPLIPAAAAARRDDIVTRTWPGAAASAAAVAAREDSAAGPVQTGSDPARADPGVVPAIAALSRRVGLPAVSRAVAVPGAGQVTAGRCQGLSTGTCTRRARTGNTGTGFSLATGRSAAGPASPVGGCLIPASSGTTTTSASAPAVYLVSRPARRPRARHRRKALVRAIEYPFKPAAVRSRNGGQRVVSRQ
jgi:hypothetical protein